MLEYSSYYQSQTCVHGEKKVTQKLTFRQIQYNFFYINTIRKLQEKECLLNWSDALVAACSADKKNLIHHSIY